MDTYDDLLRALDDHKLLERAINVMSVEEQSLNLVHPDWKRALLHHSVYKEFNQSCSNGFHEKRRNKSSFDVQHVRHGNYVFNVTVVGRFRIATASRDDAKSCTSSLVCVDACDPLDQIMDVMTSDVDPTIERRRTHKFFFEACNLKVCVHCKTALSKTGPETPSLKDQCCITKCKVYDGDCVFNTFQSLVEDGGGKLLAAVTVVINARYFYKLQGRPQTVKIGGLVKNVVFFSESALKPKEIVKTRFREGFKRVLAPRDEEMIRNMFTLHKKPKTEDRPTQSSETSGESKSVTDGELIRKAVRREVCEVIRFLSKSLSNYSPEDDERSLDSDFEPSSDSDFH